MAMIPGLTGPNMASSSKWLQDSATVSDPSDWLGGPFSFLKDLDSTLRCEICSDILRAPVSIKSCSHTFCSRCIRDYINQPSAPGAPTDRPCPNCRQPKVYDSELIPVPQLEIAAEAWRSARPHLSTFSEQEVQRKAARADQSVSNGTKRKGRALDDDDDDEADLQQAQAAKHNKLSPPSPKGSRRRLTRSCRQNASTGGSPSHDNRHDSEEAAIVVDDDSDEDWTVEAEKRSPSKRKSPKATSSHVNGKSLKDMTASDVVECPMCGYTFTMLALNRHLDSPNACKGPDGPPPSDRDRGLPSKTNGKTSSTPGFGGWLQPGKNSSSTSSAAAANNTKPSIASDAVKLKRPQYHLLSERQLRQICKDCGLDTSGKSSVLESRHRRWIDLYNANLDASPKYRRSEAQLKRDIREWDQGREREEARLRKLNSSSASSTSSGGAGSGTKAKNGAIVGGSEEERRAYAVSHSHHFRQLIAESRKSHAANKQTHANAVAQSADAEQSASSITSQDQVPDNQAARVDGATDASSDRHPPQTTTTETSTSS